MHALRQYWERLFSRLKPSRPDGHQTAAAADIEHEISVISGESHALAEEVQRVRSDFERARDEENRKIVNLEQLRQAMQLAREEDQRKLAELESLNSRFEAAREVDSRKILDLESRLAGIEIERKQSRDQVKILEDSLTEATARLERTDRQIRDLQAGSVEQARRFEASLADASNRFESTDNQLRILGIKLENERQHAQKVFDSVLGRLRKQDVRLKWTIMAAGFVVLLGTVAGAVLIRDVQKNAALLASMSQDIRALMTSVNGQLGMRQTPPQARPQLALPVSPPGPGVTAKPASGGTAVSQPSSSASATLSQPESGSDSPGSALQRGLAPGREGKRQYSRQEARAFFLDNAKVDGVVSLASGVQYRVVKPGSGKSPSFSDQVVVSYVGIKPDGAVFDETYSTGAPSTFSMKELMPGWREVLMKMQEGAEFELYVPPKLATSGGTRKRSMLGFEPSIYLIELMQVVKTGATDASAPLQ